MYLGTLISNSQNDLINILGGFRQNIASENEFANRIIELYKNGLTNNPVENINLFQLKDFMNFLTKSLLSKIKRTKKIESESHLLSDDDYIKTIEGSLKSGFYNYLRHIYNKNMEQQNNESYLMAIYLFIREFCYSSMFRYNSKGEFNVPYGGISYNRKNLLNKIEYIQDKRLVDLLNDTVIKNHDFYDFMKKYRPEQNDFIFLDPPYDTDFSTYSKNKFDKQDQIRLSEYLLNECDAQFLMVIKDSELISSLYKNGHKTKLGKKIVIEKFNKNYMVSFKNRNKKETVHLLIKNY
jgi:DNA adenine methylase